MVKATHDVIINGKQYAVGDKMPDSVSETEKPKVEVKAKAKPKTTRRKKG